MINTPTLTSLMTVSRDFALRSRDFALRYWPALAVLAVVLMALAGYAAWPRMTATTATAATTSNGWSRVCVGGVSYLQFTSGASVEWTPAGKVKTCTEPSK